MMIKRTVLLFCICLSFLFCGSVKADTPNDLFTYTLLPDGSASITECRATGNVVIPSSIDGHVVINLAKKLFYGESNIQSVTIPETVTYFGTDHSSNEWDYVFSYCYDLKYIQVSENNPSFCSVDGVLYSKDQRYLLNYPAGKSGSTYHVPANVLYLACTSFGRCKYLRDLYVDGADTWWYTYTFSGDGNMTVHYRPGGHTETKVQMDIADGLSGPENNRPVFTTSENETPVEKVDDDDTSLEKASITVKDQIYSGEPLEPSVTVYLKGQRLFKDQDYTVEFSNNTNIGQANVTIIGVGAFTGSKTAIFMILPAAPRLISAKNGSKKMTVTWEKENNVSGYQIQYGSKKSFKDAKTVTISKASTNRAVIKGLMKKRTYYVRIRAFCRGEDGRKYTSTWSESIIVRS